MKRSTETSSDYPQPEAEKRRDDLLHTLLKTPPAPRPKRERDEKKPKPRKERSGK